jgi:hypothetical protein
MSLVASNIYDERLRRWGFDVQHTHDGETLSPRRREGVVARRRTPAATLSPRRRRGAYFFGDGGGHQRLSAMPPPSVATMTPKLHDVGTWI